MMKIKDMLITPNKYSRPQTKLNKVDRILVHWVANAGSTAENNARYFDGLKIGKKNGSGGYTYASAHYIIGNDGVVIRCVPENEVAYHASEAKSYSIGIEMCHPDNGGKFTQAAYDTLIELLVDLCKRYKLEPTVGIIRHYDVTGKDCPRYYVKNKSEWVKLKEDVSRGMKKDPELESAVKVLQDKGIISSPDVWVSGKYSEGNVRSLILKVASCR